MSRVHEGEWGRAMWIIVAVVALVAAYLIRNGMRNSDASNRKCAAEICEYLTGQEQPGRRGVLAIFVTNGRNRAQANHVLSMVPPLLIRAGYSPNDMAMRYVPMMREAVALIGVAEGPTINHAKSEATHMRPTDDKSSGKPRLHVDQTDWHIDGGTLRKRYQYRGLAGHDSVTLLQIDIDKSRSAITGQIEPHVFFLVSPSFWPGMPQGFLIAQLATIDQPAEAPFTTVMVGPADDGSLIIGTTTLEAARTFLSVIAEGKPMRLMLFNKAEQLAEFPIPNDSQFSLVADDYFE